MEVVDKPKLKPVAEQVKAKLERVIDSLKDK